MSRFRPHRGRSTHAVQVLSKRRLDRFPIVFFDDAPENFEQLDRLCPCVLRILSPVGVPATRRTDPVLRSRRGWQVLGPYQREDPPMVFDGAGLSAATVQTLLRLLPECKGVQQVVLDFDRTITQWEGLFDRDTARMFAEVTDRSRGGTTRAGLLRSLLGPPKRARLMLRLLTELAATQRGFILTNQPNGKGIRQFLRYAVPDAASLRVVGYAERQGRSKGEYLGALLQDACFSCGHAGREDGGTCSAH